MISISAVLVALFLLVYGLLAVLAIRRPLLGRLALRQALGRPWQSILLVAGLTVASSMVLAEQITSDSITDSLTAAAYRSWGRADVTVTAAGQFFDRDVARQLASDSAVRRAFPGVQAGVEVTGAVVDLDRQLGKAGVRLVGFDTAAQPPFGAYVLTNGRRTYGDDLAAGQVLISRSLAESLQAHAGDRLRVGVAPDGGQNVVTVAGIARAEGPGGYGLRPSVFAASTTMSTLTGTDRVNVIRLTARGESRAELDAAHAGIPAVRAVLSRAPSDARLHVSEAKAADVEALRKLSDENRPTIFLFGLLVVAAAVAVVVNLALALAAERRPHLAVLRALGLSRADLVAVAVLEGAIYSLLAAVVCILPGLLGGLYIVSHRGNVIDPLQGADASLRLAVTPVSLMAAVAAGSLVALLTTLCAAINTSRLSISAGVRDIPDTFLDGRSSRVRLAVMALLAPLGVGLLLAGGPVARIMGGLSLILLVMMAARGRISERLRSTLAGAAATIWAIGIVAAQDPETLRSSAASVLFVTVLAGVGGPAVILAANLRLIEDLAGFIGWTAGLRATLRPPLAYMTRRPLRAGLSTGALALLLAVLAVFAVFFGTVKPDYQRDSGGYDVRVTSIGSPAVNLPKSIADRVEKTLVIPTRAYVGPYRSSTSLSGPPFGWHREYVTLYEFTDDLLTAAPLPLTNRDPRFNSDADVWHALRSDPHLVVTGPFGAGSRITLIGADGPVELRVAASFRPGVLTGLIGSSRAMRPFNGFTPGTTLLVRARSGIDAAALALDTRRALITDGVDAIPTHELLDAGLTGLRDYVAEEELLMRLSLVVGVISIGILSLRAAVERRRAIGVLRALGYQSRALLAGMVLEALVTATAAMLVGLTIGLLVGQLAMRTLFPTDEVGMEASSVAATVAAVYCTVLVVTVGPAIRASRLPAAEALRLVG